MTWGIGTTGVSGVVSAANSLVGSTVSDRVGLSRITTLSKGNYVVPNPYWDNGAVGEAGAVMWANGTTGISGIISPANSLVGSTAFDSVGHIGGANGHNDGVMALSNGNSVTVRTHR